MKKALLLILIPSATTLTAVAAWRLSVDALALIAGALLGMLAMSPALLVILWLLRANAQAHSQQAPPAYPPIIVAGGIPMSPPQQTTSPQHQAPLPPPPARAADNAFTPTARRWVMRVYDEE